MQFLKQTEINARYITNYDLEKVLEKLNKNLFKISVAGKSVQHNNIYRIDFGTGSFKILLWSQMHGNETTTTKAVFNLLQKINTENHANWLSFFTFTFLPILNPDGAEAFTRVNANAIDLNRDSKNLTQPESQTLRNVFNSLQPHLALNMHDQRSIFSAGPQPHTATLSFLAPAFNEARDLNENRAFAMKLIALMNNGLKKTVHKNIGRFDDGFNINCIGDMFTFLNTPTILFEAGFAINDYQREKARKLVETSLNNLFNGLIFKEYEQFTIADYLEIPENEKNFVDLVVENYVTNNADYKKINKLPVVFKEYVKKNEVILTPVIDFESAPHYKYAHYVLNAKNQQLNNDNDVLNLLKSVVIP